MTQPGKITHKELITTSNDLLLSARWPKLTINEQRLVLYMLSRVRMDDEDFKTYRISVLDLAAFLGIESKNIYERFDEATNGLMSKIIRWIDPEYKDRLQKVTWCSSAMLARGDGFVELSFDPKLKPFLLFLKDNFTQYEADAVFNLKNHYSLRLYQLIKCYQGKARMTRQKSVTVELDWFKEFMDVELWAYPNFGPFKHKVLNPSLEEVEDKTDLIVTFKPIKTGRKVTHLEFFWEYNPKYNQKTITDGKPSDDDVEAEKPKKPEKKSDEINQRLRELGFSDIKKLRKKHENQVFIDAFTDLDFELDQRSKSNKEPLKNVGAWLRGRLPEQGQPYQYSSTYEKRLSVEKAKAECLKKEQERLKKESEEEAERQRQIKEVSAKVDAKIVEIKGTDEWLAIQEQARTQAERYVSPPENDKKELNEFARRKLKNLPENELSLIKMDATEYIKSQFENLNLSISVDSQSFQSAVANHQVEIVKQRYQAEFPENPSMKQYRKRLEKHMEIETRNIIKKRI